VQTFCFLLTKCRSRKSPPIFESQRTEETEKDKDQDYLRVEEAEGDGNTIEPWLFSQASNTNPKVGKTFNESRIFRRNG